MKTPQVEPRSAPLQSHKYVIVTGDDLGLNSKANEAIEQLHQAGLLTQASLMVNEPGVDEAVRIARRNPGLHIGLHLTLCLGRGSPCSRGTALVDAAQALPHSPAGAGLAYAFRPSLQEPLRREIEAQFARFKALGFGPTYWDGHTHLHLHPRVMALALPIAHEAGFHAVRLVRSEGWKPLPLIFRWLSRAARPKLEAAGIAAAARLYGLEETGRMTTCRFARCLDAIAALPMETPSQQEPFPQWSEIYLHPGAEPEPLDVPLLKEALREKEIILGHTGQLHFPDPPGMA